MNAPGELAVPRNETTVKVGREAAQFALRMPVELRDRLHKAALVNGRSVNSEILTRLQLSLDRQDQGRRRGYTAAQDIPQEQRIENDTERAMINVFRRMPPEKQLALLSLFK